ncbi:MAG: hypothetical protein ACJ8F3_17855 [Xanthobacteraceae bacterium]
MRFVGAISLVTGVAGATIPIFQWGEPWGYLLSFALCIIVGVAHNWVLANEKISK